jgi:hypothetical protein
VAEIACDFIRIQVGSLETQEFRQQPIPFVVLPNGNVVEPRVEKGAVRPPITLERDDQPGSLFWRDRVENRL